MAILPVALRKPITVALLLSLMAVHSLLALGWRASYLPGSAMALALGGGGAAHPYNIALTMANPVHVWGLDGEALEVGHLRMFGDLKGYNLRWHRTVKDRPLQLVLHSMVEDEIELRSDIPTAQPLGYFSARLMTASIIRGWQLGGIRIGVNLTGAYQRIFEYSAWGTWMSAGIQGEPLPWMRWGLTVSNLGFATVLNVESESVIPRLGAALAVKTPLQSSYLSLDLWGDEYRGFVPAISWRGSGSVLGLTAGVRWEKDTPLITAGIDISYHQWTIAYAYGYQETTLGQPHLLSLGRNL
ncbi:hypothetical protein ACFL5M_03015 [Candidatus Neomarinimicrobiota bacterium]